VVERFPNVARTLHRTLHHQRFAIEPGRHRPVLEMHTLLYAGFVDTFNNMGGTREPRDNFAFGDTQRLYHVV